MRNEYLRVSTGYFFPPIIQINVYKIFDNIFACFNFFQNFVEKVKSPLKGSASSLGYRAVHQRVKAISDTLKQIGPSTFVNFTRPIIRHLDVSVLFCYIKLY